MIDFLPFSSRAFLLSSGGWGLKNPQRGPLLSIFYNSRKNNCQAFFVTFALRPYKSYYPAHAPGQHMWPSPGPWPGFQCSKTVEVGCSFQDLCPLLMCFPRWDIFLHRFGLFFSRIPQQIPFLYSTVKKSFRGYTAALDLQNKCRGAQAKWCSVRSTSWMLSPKCCCVRGAE